MEGLGCDSVSASAVDPVCHCAAHRHCTQSGLPTMRKTQTPLLLLAAALLHSFAAVAAEETIPIAINTARVWLTQMEDLAANVAASTATAGMPPAETNFTINRAHRYRGILLVVLMSLCGC